MQAEKDAENEVMLAQAEFKGKCNACGKRGHKAANCKSKKNNANGERNEKAGKLDLKENAAAVAREGTRKPIAGRKKKMLISTQKIGNKRWRSMPQMWKPCLHILM